MADHPIHPLAENVATAPDCKLARAFAVWTDLLGFGGPFASANWEPDPAVWRAQAERIGRAYRAQCGHINLTTDDSSYMLLLNDGMVRSLAWKDDSDVFELGSWLRAALFAHYSVLQSEFRYSLPGPRTIISAGWTAQHSFGEVRIDDLVFNYTRDRPGPSEIAQKTGNLQLVSNPAQLQLNTAFSRAFLLDEAGSKHGVVGANVYLDQAFIDAVRSIFGSCGNLRVIDWQRDSDRVFAVERVAEDRIPVEPNEVLSHEGWLSRLREIQERDLRPEEAFPSRRQPWPFGLLLEREPISVQLRSLQTTVHRVEGFFPYDEDPASFLCDLEPTTVAKELEQRAQRGNSP